jgi:hypothetical protein
MSELKKRTSSDRLAYGEIEYGRIVDFRKHFVYIDRKTRRDSRFTVAMEGVSVAG